MLSVVGSTPAVFALAPNTLTLQVPAGASDGDILLAIISRPSGEPAIVPAGWTAIAIPGIGSGRAFDVLVREHAKSLPPDLWLRGMVGAAEWQGAMFLVRGGSIGALLESQQTAAFVSPALNAPNAPVSQANDLALWLWSIDAASIMAPPSGTHSRAYASSAVTARGFLAAARTAGLVGALGIQNMAVGGVITGFAATLILRDRYPVQPAELLDTVPGNIGLIGRDLRPPREVDN